MTHESEPLVELSFDFLSVVQVFVRVVPEAGFLLVAD